MKLDLPDLSRFIDLGMFDRLSPRERKIVIGGAASLVALGLFLMVKGTVDRLDRLDKRAASARERLVRVNELIADYQALESEYEALLRQAQGRDPLARVVEAHARRAKVEENITAVKDRAAPPGDEDFEMSGVEVQLQDAPLGGLVDLMAALEHDPRSLLQFGRVRIEGQGEIGKRKMDANLQVLRFVSRAQG